MGEIIRAIPELLVQPLPDLNHPILWFIPGNDFLSQVCNIYIVDVFFHALVGVRRSDDKNPG